MISFAYNDIFTPEVYSDPGDRMHGLIGSKASLNPGDTGSKI
jgi:hypothetical protein